MTQTTPMPALEPCESARGRADAAGKIFAQSLLAPGQTDYFVRFPSNPSAKAPLIVSVHGISRNPLQHMIYMAPIAERLGAILIAPYFAKKRYRGYQQLAPRDDVPRPDIFLDRIIAQVRAQACSMAGLLSGSQTGSRTGSPSDPRPGKIHLFGFSGGGQFCHRYAMTFPEKVAAVVSVAAGWYTFPDPRLPYPLGIAPAESAPTAAFDPASFAAVPILVAVGDRDRLRNASLNTSERIDQLQGETRIERGERWVRAMNENALHYGRAAPVIFSVMKKVGHSLRSSMIRGGLGDIAAEFLHNSITQSPANQPAADH